jgi:hypothetical protein
LGGGPQPAADSSASQHGEDNDGGERAGGRASLAGDRGPGGDDAIENEGRAGDDEAADDGDPAGDHDQPATGDPTTEPTSSPPARPTDPIVTTTTRPSTPHSPTTTTTTTMTTRPPQVPPPNTPPPPPPAPGTRDATQWPFAATDPWNTPLGSGATFDSGPTITWGQGANGGGNSDYYAIPVYYASNSDPQVTVDLAPGQGGGSQPGPHTIWLPAGALPAVGGDHSIVIIEPDRRHADDMWLFDRGTLTYGAFLHYDLQGPAWIGWMRGAGTSFLGGLIRPSEIRAGTIPHALAFASSGLQPPNAPPCPIWPAQTCDGSQEAGLLAIPSSTPKPGGLSPLASAMWDALVRYGAYDIDNAGGNVFYTESNQTDPGDAATIDAAARDLPVVEAAMRWVTNNGPSNPGGPGARLAPLPAPFG